MSTSSAGSISSTGAAEAPITVSVGLLSSRERDVLRLMAQGRSNAGIAALLGLSHRTVESHVTAIFDKLGIAKEDEGNRRVRAVLAWLAGGATANGQR